MKILLIVSVMALASTGALADEYGGHSTTVTVTEHFSKSVERADLPCYAVTANYNKGWKHVTCPPKGSGPSDRSVSRTFEVKVPCPEPKATESNL